MRDPEAPTVAVIGGGPAGLMAAEVLARGGAAVTVFDRMPSVGRKFLLAGRGGLNLTHAEPYARFVGRYADPSPRLRAALDEFGPDAVRAWAEALGQETFVGSSGRVFPRSWKASPLLRAWLGRLDALGVRFALRRRWIGFGPGGALLVSDPAGEPAEVAADAVVLALGGASWPRLGSDGAWIEPLRAAGVDVAPLRPANCGLRVGWSEPFRTRFEGEPLKRIGLSFGGRTLKGEAVVTAAGLEGGIVYPLSSAVREAIEQSGDAVLVADLRPDLAADALAATLRAPRGKQSLSTWLRKRASLPPVTIGLLREAFGAALPHAPEDLAAAIKAVPLRVTGTAPVERAISSAGGLSWSEVDERFMLRSRPGIFVAGEMLDWDAPTGGYLLTACMATGVAAGRGVLDWLAREQAIDPGPASVDGALPVDRPHALRNHASRHGP